MPSKSQSQRGLIFGRRNKYGSKKNTPKKWKFIWDEGWENKGKLPESSIFPKFSEFINEKVIENPIKEDWKFSGLVEVDVNGEKKYVPVYDK